MTKTATDTASMTAALAQAEAGNTMFGAVLLRAETIVARAYNTVSQTNDPSAHAELNLVRDYCRAQNLTTLSGFTLYTTAEPCPMCAALCTFTGISEIVFGVFTADLAALGVPQIGLSCKEVISHGPTTIAVRGGVLRELCLAHCKTLSTQSS